MNYPVQPRLEAGVFADVALHADASMAPNNDAPTAFTITFQPKQAHWAYYFVTKPAILTGTEPPQTALVQVIKYITHAFSTSNN
ncbi:MAG: hypothetical protein IH820_05335 [Bacteroidetes bacterium]|nr:hypothetical protein [Bacteroidota bacterium]